MSRASHLLAAPVALWVLLSGAAPALAGGGVLEAVVGVAHPLGDDDYDDVVDTSLKLGARGVVWATGAEARVQLGLELGADYTPASMEDDVEDWMDVTRLRALVGARAGLRASPTALVFARCGIGIDRVEAEGDLPILGHWSEDDTGLALEAGGGVLVRVGGRLVAGAHVALPVALHSDDDDDGRDNDYTGIDLDLLLAVGGWW